MRQLLLCTVATAILALGLADSLLDHEFCQLYYPNDLVNQGYAKCADVVAKTKSNMSRPLPTIELGDPTKPGMFFIHGWPDSAAEWAPQFAHFCYSGRFYCVAATWQNFHPDVPDDAEDDLKFTVTFEKLAATMRAAGLRDTTFVIHDWGAFIGYQMLYRYPELINRTIAFDIGATCDGCTTNTTYQDENRAAWAAKDSQRSIGSAEYWRAPCPTCASWRTTWPYVSTLSFRDLKVAPNLGPSKPLMFLWGNMTRGKPRGADSKFFGQSWLDYVENDIPHGRVVETPGDHWMHINAARFTNTAIDGWLKSLHVEDSAARVLQI